MDFKQIMKKYTNKKSFLIILALGIVLILMSNTIFEEKEPAKENKVFKTDQRALEDILSNIKGAGRVKVYITYVDDGTKIVATDNKRRGGESDETETVVKVVGKGGGGQEPYVLSEKTPEIKGILVTATGATDQAVKVRLYNSVQAATGVPLHRINVEAGNK